VSFACFLSLVNTLALSGGFGGGVVGGGGGGGFGGGGFGEGQLGAGLGAVNWGSHQLPPFEKNFYVVSTATVQQDANSEAFAQTFAGAPRHHQEARGRGAGMA